MSSRVVNRDDRHVTTIRPGGGGGGGGGVGVGCFFFLCFCSAGVCCFVKAVLPLLSSSPLLAGCRRYALSRSPHVNPLHVPWVIPPPPPSFRATALARLITTLSTGAAFTPWPRRSRLATPPDHACIVAEHGLGSTGVDLRASIAPVTSTGRFWNARPNATFHLDRFASNATRGLVDPEGVSMKFPNIDPVIQVAAGFSSFASRVGACPVNRATPAGTRAA